METQPEYRPYGGPGFDEWNECWAAGENRWDSCNKPGDRNTLGLCANHYEELCRP